VTGSHSAQTYTAQAFYQLGGTVTLNGSPLAGVALAATNGVACSNSNSSGQYSCTVPSGWSGSVTPALGIYNFTPASRSYSSVTTHQTTQGYATATYQVSGTVTAGGSPVVGATINATNGVTCSPTNTAGQYSCTVHSGWSGSVAPILSGHIFTPASRAYTSIASNATTDDYAAAVLSGPSQVFFIHADHLDTPRLVSNAAGTAVWRWDQQEPFGVNVPDENPSSLGAYEFPLRFPGQYFDKETNLHYNYFRDYDPANGRYAQSDPIGLDGGVNTYAYVDSGPLVLFDPEGLTPPRVVPRTTPRVPQAVTEKWRNTPQEKIPRNQITKPKDDIPSWAKGERPTNAETPKDFAKRVMDKRYGSDNYHTRGKGEYSQIKKYAETHFRPTSKPIVNEFVPFEWWDPFWEPWRGNPAEQWGPSCLI
jgi:RHS repeat-associated protein